MFFVALAACGGGGNDGSDTAIASDSNNVNAPFAGTLFVGEKRIGHTLDLTTGNFERIAGVKWEEDLNGRAYPQAFSFEASPRPFSGEDFVVTVDGCQLNRAQRFSILDHCIALHDADGSELAVRLFEARTKVGARLSRDGRHIATAMDNDLVVVLDRELAIVSQGRADEAVSIRSMSWLSEDRFVFSSNDAIWIGSIRDPAGRLLARFPEDDLDQIWAVSASPDAQRLALAYGDEVFILELDSGQLRRLPIASTFGFLSARMVAWSPDGAHLAVKVQGTGLTWTGPRGQIREGGGTNVFVNNGVVIVPTNFGQAGGDGQTVLDAHLVSARTDMYKRNRSASEAPLDVLLNFDDEAPFWWLP